MHTRGGGGGGWWWSAVVGGGRWWSVVMMVVMMVEVGDLTVVCGGESEMHQSASQTDLELKRQRLNFGWQTVERAWK